MQLLAVHVNGIFITFQSNFYSTSNVKKKTQSNPQISKNKSSEFTFYLFVGLAY